MSPRLASLYRTGKLNCAAEKQQLLGKRGLAGVRVRDDRKGSPPGNLLDNFGHSQKAWREKGVRALFPEKGSDPFFSATRYLVSIVGFQCLGENGSVFPSLGRLIVGRAVGDLPKALFPI